MKRKLIIFDFNGVTVNGGHKDTMQVLGKRYGHDWQELMDVFYTKYHNQVAVGEISVRDAWEKPLKHFNINMPWQDAMQLHLSLPKLNTKVCAIADRLRKGSYTCIVVSKNVKEYWEYYLRTFHFDRYYDEVVNLQDYKLPKASAETLQFLLDRYQVNPEEVVYIDDQEQNLAIPKKEGVHTILYQTFAQFEQELNAAIA